MRLRTRSLESARETDRGKERERGKTCVMQPLMCREAASLISLYCNSRNISSIAFTCTNTMAEEHMSSLSSSLFPWDDERRFASLTRIQQSDCCCSPSPDAARSSLSLSLSSYIIVLPSHPHPLPLLPFVFPSLHLQPQPITSHAATKRDMNDTRM